MDQATDNPITSYLRTTEETLGPLSHFTPGSRPRPVDANKQ
jgi:hypothetical protein